mmetsp:Transcript_518/g.1789  ORF Transcript_518/g.1789 Transcript_518/m.1789 type:complete len:295 (+) Transcript_518:830-1714(+)
MEWRFFWVSVCFRAETDGPFGAPSFAVVFMASSSKSPSNSSSPPQFSLPSRPLHQPCPLAGPGRHLKESLLSSVWLFEFSSSSSPSSSENSAAWALRYTCLIIGKPGRNAGNTSATRRFWGVVNELLCFSVGVVQPFSVCIVSPKLFAETCSPWSSPSPKNRKHRTTQTPFAPSASFTTIDFSRSTSRNFVFLFLRSGTREWLDKRTPTCRITTRDSATTVLAMTRVAIANAATANHANFVSRNFPIHPSPAPSRFVATVHSVAAKATARTHHAGAYELKTTARTLRVTLYSVV